MMHSEEKPYNCNFCSKTFSNNSNLAKHKRLHTGEKPYKCDICERTFYQRSALSQHKMIHTGARPYNCDICKKTFMRSSVLTRHKIIHTGEKPYSCRICQKSYSRISHLSNHNKSAYHLKREEMINKDSPDLLNNYVNCGETIKVEEIEEEIKEEESKTSPNNSNLAKHKLLHTGEKPYKCDICEKTFNQSGALSQHKMIHKGARPYECDICKKTFMRSSVLTRHKLIHTGEKPYSCRICQKSYSRSEHLTKHNKSTYHLKREESINKDSFDNLNNYVNCGKTNKVEVIEGEIKEEESVDDPIPSNNYIQSVVKLEIKEEVKESDEGQGVEDSSLDTDNLVDCSQFVQIEMNLPKSQ